MGTHARRAFEAQLLHHLAGSVSGVMCVGGSSKPGSTRHCGCASTKPPAAQGRARRTQECLNKGDTNSYTTVHKWRSKGCCPARVKVPVQQSIWRLSNRASGGSADKSWVAGSPNKYLEECLYDTRVALWSTPGSRNYEQEVGYSSSMESMSVGEISEG